ncbi:stress-related protein-like [Hibiscus syriacus]|uniref:stress-related protein-like n=1 Tax=Hibiscus syriacus TaxID=106335 RepID=UPI0019239741|nr:stress-related protein-like [Hibiscus syriacus]
MVKTTAETTVKSSTSDSDPKQTEAIEENIQKKLKYLDFVQVASIYAVVCVSSIYEYVKGNSGPLKPGVNTVEKTVKAFIGPVYDKFHDVPFRLLEFFDRKVDELERHVPSIVKQASCLARTMASEVRRVGVLGAAKTITRDVYTKCEPTAKEMYGTYEPVAEQYAVSAWRSFNRLPLFPRVAHRVVVPAGAYCSQKYNQVVRLSGEKGYAVASYLPLIPTDRFAKVFGEGHVVSTSSNGESVRGQWNS